VAAQVLPPWATVVGHAAVGRSARRIVLNRRGPWRLASTPMGGRGCWPNRRLDLKPPWATAAAVGHSDWFCQNYKILKPPYNFAKWLKNKKSCSGLFRP
jgi:hypothetical protein